MKTIFALFIWIVSLDVVGRTIGIGELTLGVSQLANDTSYGAGLAYDLNYDTNYQRTIFNLLGEHSSSNSEANSARTHSKLYESEMLSLHIENEAFIQKPNFNWKTSSNIEYSKIVNSDDKNEGWDITTGPSFYKNIRKDLLYSLEYVVGKFNANENDSSTQEIEMGIIKVFPSTNAFNVYINQDCWNYRDTQLEDNCIQTFSSSYEIKGRNHKIDIMFGSSRIDDSKEDVYSFSYVYEFSSLDSLTVLYQKENSNLRSRITRIESLSSLPSAIIRKERLIETKKTFNRISFSVEANRVNYESELGELEEHNAGLDIRYGLRSSACLSCSLIYSYTESKLQTINFKEQFIGIEYPMRRDMIGLLTARYSEDQILGKYYSLNFQIKYSANRKLLAAE